MTLMDPMMIDVLKYIIKFVKNDKDKCRFIMTCKEISKYEFYFHDEIAAIQIINSQWFNKFTNVLAYDLKILPSAITCLYLKEYKSDIVIYDDIPSSVKYLKFGDFRSSRFEGNIPSSVTHLTFFIGNPPMKKIPLSITHLSLKGSYLVFPIFSKDFIPSSVTHLICDDYFFMLNLEIIPSSVTHLFFKGIENWHHPRDIPHFVTGVRMGKFTDDQKKLIEWGNLGNLEKYYAYGWNSQFNLASGKRKKYYLMLTRSNQ